MGWTGTGICDTQKVSDGHPDHDAMTEEDRGSGSRQSCIPEPEKNEINSAL